MYNCDHDSRVDPIARTQLNVPPRPAHQLHVANSTSEECKEEGGNLWRTMLKLFASPQPLLSLPLQYLPPLRPHSTPLPLPCIHLGYLELLPVHGLQTLSLMTFAVFGLYYYLCIGLLCMHCHPHSRLLLEGVCAQHTQRRHGARTLQG